MRVFNDINTYITLGVIAILYFSADPRDEYDFWVRLVDSLPGNWSDSLKFAVISQVVLEATFWFLVGMLFLLERSGFLDKYRIQPLPTDTERIKREADLTKEAFKGVLISHLIQRPVVLYFAFQVFEWISGPLRSPVPSIRTLLPQIFLCMLIDDAWFYSWHRIFHEVPWLYRTVHKQHHQFYRPNVFATEHAHPIEDLWVNSLGTIIGPLLLRVHPILLIVYPAMKMYQSMEAHSGYNIPFPLSLTSIIDSMDCAPAHDFHHSHIVSNYGGWFMFFDWAFGTDKKYEHHITVKRKDDSVYDTARRPYVHDTIGWKRSRIFSENLGKVSE